VKFKTVEARRMGQTTLEQFIQLRCDPFRCSLVNFQQPFRGAQAVIVRIRGRSCELKCTL
jgi:hypothetical protein